MAKMLIVQPSFAAAAGSASSPAPMTSPAIKKDVMYHFVCGTAPSFSGANFRSLHSSDVRPASRNMPNL